MDKIKQTINRIIVSSITNKKNEIPEEIDFEELYDCLKRHSIRAIGYDGMVRCGADKQHPVMVKLYKNYIRELMYNEKQNIRIKELIEKFKEKGIDYLSLKGMNLKLLYPKKELRSMGDVDILIKENQYPSIKKIMVELGYTRDAAARNTINWKSDKLYVELHTRLVPDAAEDYYNYYSDSWSRARKIKGNEYSFSKEDEYIYVFIHFAKHFRYSGIGYRQLIDLWVYKRFYPDLDEEYILNEMEKVGLKVFYKNTLKTISACFENGENDEVTEIIGDYIFDSGNWGTEKSVILNQNVKSSMTSDSKLNNSKINTLFSMIFPGPDSLKVRYKIVEKYRWMTPIFWVIRWFDVLLFRRRNISLKLKQVAEINEKEVDSRRKLFDAIGLKYNF